MIGAEITARETADLILPAIRSAGSPSPTTGGGRKIHFLQVILVILGIATTTFSSLAYYEAKHINDRRNLTLEHYHYLGRSVMEHPKVKVELIGPDFIIHFDNTLNENDLFDATIHLPHNIPPKDLERLMPNQK
jgi:hypothetical protein